MEKILKIKNLLCGYKNSFQLEIINFEVDRGMFLGIIGPNGSGKSTFLKSLCSEIKIQRGTIYLNNCDLVSLTTKERAKRIAVVSQKMEVSYMKTEDYVLLGRLPYKSNFQLFDSSTDTDIAHKYMNLCGVLNLKDKLLSEMSGGEQQLASIAKALAQEPELLLLDEPTSHLDLAHQMRILNLLQKLNEELNLSIIMIIHDLNLAAEFCKKLAIMKDGKIFTSGEASLVINQKIIEEVYNTSVLIQINSFTQKPTVSLVSDKTYEKAHEGKVWIA